MNSVSQQQTVLIRQGENYQTIAQKHKAIVKCLQNREKMSYSFNPNTLLENGSQEDVEETLACIKQIKVTSVDANHSKVRNIFHQIRDISFPNLRSILFSTVNLRSIEGINRYSMPQLRIFWININQVNSLKSMRKAQFPFLKTMGIDGNYFLEVDCLTQGHFPQMDKINLEYDTTTLKIESEDLSFLGKLQTALLNDAYAQGKRRIGQKRVIQVLQKRFKSKPFIKTFYAQD